MITFPILLGKKQVFRSYKMIPCDSLGLLIRITYPWRISDILALFLNVQVVTIANAGGLRPGALVTVLPGQPGATLRQPHTATTFTTNARDSAPRLVTQPLPSGVTLVRPPPAILGSSSAVRAPVGASSAGTTSTAPAGRMPVALATLPSPAAASASGSLHQEMATPVSFLY